MTKGNLFGYMEGSNQFELQRAHLRAKVGLTFLRGPSPRCPFGRLVLVLGYWSLPQYADFVYLKKKPTKASRQGSKLIEACPLAQVFVDSSRTGRRRMPTLQLLNLPATSATFAELHEKSLCIEWRLSPQSSWGLQRLRLQVRVVVVVQCVCVLLVFSHVEEYWYPGSPRYVYIKLDSTEETAQRRTKTFWSHTNEFIWIYLSL